jgi:hypothetical protein
MDFNAAVAIITAKYKRCGVEELAAMKRRAYDAELSVEEYEAFKVVFEGMRKLFQVKEG